MDLLRIRGALVGVIHLPALPGAPLHASPVTEILDGVWRDARTLSQAGFDAIIVENFGDVPFHANAVASETIASMTLAVDRAMQASGLPVGVNVLRNDGRAALGIAVATAAAFVRVNVLVAARVTDQGLVQSQAAELLRARRSLGAERIRILADVDVKHSIPLGPSDAADEAIEASERALADVVIVSGARTGAAADPGLTRRVRDAVHVPVWLGSGVRHETLGEWLDVAHGVIVGSALRRDGRAGGAIDPGRAAEYVAIRNAWRDRTGG